MAVTDQQKLDFLLKKIGYTKTKTGSVVGTGAISGTPKQPFAEAIPSPLVVPNSSLWNEAASIPATAPGSDTTQVKVYLAGTSGLRMTADSTSSGQRAFIAYTTYNNTSSARLTNWIDTQFGSSYLIKVYKGDPNSGGVALSAAGSGSNDGWFFDYSAGVLNFNDTSVPSGVTDTNIYIVGYRYVGQTGAPTSGISTFSYLDLTVERNLDVGVQGGISTFRNNIDANGIIEGIAGENKIPSLYANMGALPNASTYHGMFAHVHATQKGYFAHGGAWYELVNKELNGRVGTGTESYFIDRLVSTSTTATSLNVIGVTTTVTVDINGDLDVDGHTNLDNVSVAGVSTFSSNVDVNANIDVSGNSVLQGDLDVDGHTNLDNISVAGVSTFTGDATFSGSVSIGGTLTYEDVTNVDSVGLLTARSGIRVTGGVIEALAGENKIPSLYANMAALPAAGSYHGMFAHVHSTGRGYFAHAGNWLELVNKEINGVVGTGTERYNVGPIDAVDINVSSSSTTKSLNVTGVTTAVTVDINGDLDVDGHTNLDNVSIAGVTTCSDQINMLDNKAIRFGTAAASRTSIYYDSSGSNTWIKNFNDTLKIGYRSVEIYYVNQKRLEFTNGGNNFSTDVSTTFLGDNYHASWSPGSNKFQLNDNAKLAFGTQADTTIHHNNSNLLISNTTGNIDVTGNVVLNNDISVDGHTNLDNVSIAGVSTFAGTVNTASIVATGIDLNGDIDVDGHTNLDNVSIAGVTTTAGLLDINAGGQANTFKVEDLTSGRVVLAGTGGELEDNNNLRFDGTDLYVSGIRVGGGGGGIIGDDIITRNLKVNGISTHVGASIFTGNIDANGDLDVDGHTNLDNVSVAGVTTFTGTAEFDGTAKFDSTITAGGATGSNGQYLKTTGTGVAWASFPTLRTRQTSTASAGQTTFSFSYTVNFLDVFVNGIKLTDAEFTATNGTSVVLAVGCFVGDIVELVGYNTVSGGGGGGGGSLNNIVEDTTPQLGGNLDLFNKTITGTGGINMTGVVTATSFVGNGSGLTGVVASGTGVVIKNSGSTVGTAGTINFGDNLSVSPASAGIVTITGSSNFTNLSVSGIATFSGYVNTGTGATVGIGSTAYVHKIAFAEAGSTSSTLSAALGVSGSNLTFTGGGVQNGHWGNAGLKIGGNGSNALTGPEANCSLHVVSTENTRVLIHGAASAQMELRSTVGNGVENIFKSNKALDFITGTGAYSNVFRVGETEGSTFFHTLNFRASDAASKTVTIDAISGIGTFKGIVVNGATSTISNLNITGVVTATTFKGAVQATSGTFSSGVDITGDLDVDGHTDLDNVSVAGVVTATTFSGSGASLTNLPAGNLTGVLPAISGANLTSLPSQLSTSNMSDNRVVTSSGGVVFNGEANLTFDGSTLNVGTGVTVETNGQATYTGIVTAQKFVGDGSGLTGITASGSGVVVKHDGSTVGTAGTINFSTNLDVSAISAGIVTVTASGGGFSPDAQGNLVAGTNAGANFSGTNANHNILMGYEAGNALTTADNNVAIGYEALKSADTEGNNVAVGYRALKEMTSMGSNVAVGYEAGYYTYNLYNCVAVGFQAMSKPTQGSFNTWYSVAVGSGAMGACGGDKCVAIGYEALDGSNAYNSDEHTAVGYQSLSSVTFGAQQNTALGALSGKATSSGDKNIYIGYNAGNNVHATGDNCIIIGSNAAATSSSVSNEITLGDANITKLRVPGIGVTFKDNGGTPTQGHVLTVDANGEAGFAAASSSPNVGITTNLSGSFTASAGSPSTINTFGYGSGDIVVEYTVFIKNGSDFQSQKLLAMRDGTTIHSTQFAVMYSSSLLVQCDATISSGNILLRATPETGVSGSTTYKIKREVM